MTLVKWSIVGVSTTRDANARDLRNPSSSTKLNVGEYFCYRSKTTGKAIFHSANANL